MCSLVYLFTRVFREAAEAEGEDVLADVVPELVCTLGYMKENAAPAAIPMTAAMVTAEKFNSAAGSHDPALRVVMDMVERAEGEDGESDAP